MKICSVSVCCLLGVASGTEFCGMIFLKYHQEKISIDYHRILGPESAPIMDPAFWVFDIWNPSLSSTTTTTTTAVTVGTVTTRGLSTTTPLVNVNEIFFVKLNRFHVNFF